jgi:hypothetical protein
MISILEIHINKKCYNNDSQNYFHYFLSSTDEIATLDVSKIHAVDTALIISCSTTFFGSITQSLKRSAYCCVNELYQFLDSITFQSIASAFSQPFEIIFLNGAESACFTISTHAINSLSKI